jgi:YVTN family beta-propeller protein
MGNRKQLKITLIAVPVLVAMGGFAAFAFQTNIGPAQASLDFQTYKTRVEPIFLKTREGGVRCYDCHSALATRFRLQPFSSGSSSWTEEQSHQNFEHVSQLITSSNLLKSPLLVHPLAQEAGGDPAHTGGKFWKSRDDAEWQAIAAWAGVTSTSEPARAPSGSPAPGENYSRNFETFKTTVEPIFLKQRTGHARCYGCHVISNRNFRLDPLSPGKTSWNEEQSRDNFQSALQQVTPGDPSASRLLMHPLAPEAGGEAFHSGGRQFSSQNDPDWIAIAEWIRGLDEKPATSPTGDESNIYVTNSAADTIDVIDSQSNKVVQVISGIELPHGIAFSLNGERIYVSNESESVLDVINRKSGEILQKIQLSNRPNNLAITRDGKRVLVGIRKDPGLVDVIDTTTLKLVKSIPVNGSVHNVFVTPDGKYAVSGSIESKTATVIDLETEKAVWKVQFDSGVRPIAFETNADGSTSRMFVQLSGFNGFAVVDFAKRIEVTRIKLPGEPSGFGVAEGRLGTPSHGIGVSPDGKSLWVNSTVANAVFKYSLPDLKLIGHAALPLVHSAGGAAAGSVPEWIAFVPSGKVLYVSNSGAASVSAIDAATLKLLTVIPVGEVPKRLNTQTVR